MTSIVAVRCVDGVVIGSDSAVTFGAAGGLVSPIEQHTSVRLKIIDDMIVAGSGSAGLLQRFHATVDRAHREGLLPRNISGIEFGKRLADLGIRDFRSTHLERFDFTAFVAYLTNNEPFLCELEGSSGFQPELKEVSDIWYVSGGVGQQLTDPFLGLLHEAFWQEGPPNLRGGIFTVAWALKHACKLNTGGIGDPLHIAVLDAKSGQSRLLSREELAEHDNVVQGAITHLGDFRKILEGKVGAEAIPTPVPKISG